MRQIKTFSDSRLDTQCAYCGGYPDTRDHVPSKILLEAPFPDNLPVVPSCFNCNNGFSLDEEYFACLLECAIHGTTEIDQLSRRKIQNTLKYNKKLHSRIQDAIVVDDNIPTFKIEEERFRTVLFKLAFGHAKYENSETQFDEPQTVWYQTLHSMTDEQQSYFFSLPEMVKCPEIGSRSMQEMLFNEAGVPMNMWKTVQDNIYSYSVVQYIDKLQVRILIWDYLACVVEWE